LSEIAAALSLDPTVLAVSAGEDYELCFCVSPRNREMIESTLTRVGGQSTWIGEVVEGEPGVALVDARGLERRLVGFEHRW
jgi:thiamine-monophosphate kinase